MSMSPFISRFPGLGEQETRVATILEDGDLPEGEYAFLELYCDEPGCDCRRVVIQVVERSSPEEDLGDHELRLGKAWVLREMDGVGQPRGRGGRPDARPAVPPERIRTGVVQALRGDPRRPCLCGTPEAPLRDVQGDQAAPFERLGVPRPIGASEATQAGAQEVEAAAMRRPDSHAAATGALPRGGDRGAVATRGLVTAKAARPSIFRPTCSGCLVKPVFWMMGIRGSGFPGGRMVVGRKPMVSTQYRRSAAERHVEEVS